MAGEHVGHRSRVWADRTRWEGSIGVNGENHLALPAGRRGGLGAAAAWSLRRACAGRRVRTLTGEATFSRAMQYQSGQRLPER